MLSVLPREMKEIRASQSNMLDGGKIGKKGSLVLQFLVLRQLPRRPRLRGVLIKRLRKIYTKSNTKEGDVKDENKDKVKPSVVLDKNKGLDVHVLVSSSNFQSLQGLINIHFHFHNK